MKIHSIKTPFVLHQSSENSEFQTSLDSSAISNRVQKFGGKEESILLS
ncbi:MAG: hypothetical protein V7K64_16510 [Nostoc sp.]|nr:hypothetical protein [Nostoc sp. JL34]MBN3883816.1 hypothetical protein [Nostoc sp. JL34]